MSEIWRSVPNTDGVYEVSSFGRIRRAKGGQGARVGKILSQHRGRHGYPQCSLWGAPRRHTFRVHRLVTEAFLGKCPPGKTVNHRNGIRTDNRLVNLEYLTSSENQRHSYRILKARSQIGENNGNAKLTKEEVHEIRELLAFGEPSQTEIARRFGVTSSHISQIGAGRKWVQ